MYEDDGHTFNYRSGEWMRVTMAWRDRDRRLTLRLATGSKMLPPAPRKFLVRMVGSTATKEVMFAGRPVDVKL
jgi:alpha-glucosidase/alpha-D-xyloside xylohydrolase